MWKSLPKSIERHNIETFLAYFTSMNAYKHLFLILYIYIYSLRLLFKFQSVDTEGVKADVFVRGSEIRPLTSVLNIDWGHLWEKCWGPESEFWGGVSEKIILEYDLRKIM